MNTVDSTGAINLSTVANGTVAPITENINNQYVPTYWMNTLLLSYYVRSVIPLITVRPPKIVGNQIVYNEIGPVSVQETTTEEFNGTFTPGTTEWGKPITIVLDQIAIWNFQIPNILQIQSNSDLVGAKMIQAQRQLDQTIAKNVYKGIFASAGVNLGTVDVNPANIYQTISKLSTQLDLADVPEEGRYLIMDNLPWQLIQNDYIFRTTGKMQETGVLANGRKSRVVANILGFKVIKTNYLTTTPATGSTNATGQMIALSDEAYAFDVQALIPQVKEGTYGDFNQGMQGLCLYGHGPLRQEGIVVATTNISLSVPEGVQEVIDV